MHQLFISIYNFFSKRRLFLSLIVAAVFAASLYLAFQLKFEEDITNAMPTDQKLEEFKKVTKNISFMEKLMVNISLSDTSKEADPEELIAFANKLADSLNLHCGKYIKELTLQMPDDFIQEIYNTLYTNLPVFLNEDDYLRLDTLLTEESIESTVKSNYKSLVSPASMFLKKFIIRDPLMISGMALNKLKSLQADDSYELHDGYIFAKGKKNLLLIITTANPGSETSENGKFLDLLNENIDNLCQKNSNVNAEYYGGVAVAVSNAKRIKNDIIITVNIALVLVMIFISLFFRRKSIFFVLFLPAVFGATISLAILYLIKTEVSAIALGIGSVLVGITIDYSLHIFTHFRQKKNVSAVLKDVAVPILMSCFTTVCAFLCLMFVSAEALHDLGLFAALSILTAALFALLVLPHLLKLKENEKTGNKKEFFGFKLITKISSYNFDKNGILVTIIIIASIVFMYTSQNIDFDTNMENMNYVSNDLKEAEKNLENISNATLKSVYLISTGDNLNEALKNNEKLIGKVNKLKSEKLVNHYSSVHSVLISDSLQKERIKRWNDYWTVEKKSYLKNQLIESGKKYKFRESAFEEFYNLLDKDFKTVDLSELSVIKESFLSDLIVESDDLSMIITTLKVEQKNRTKVHEKFTEDENLVIFDKQYLTYKFLVLLKKDFDLLVKLSLILVLIILILALGRLELAFITFVPLAISWLWTLGLMGLFDIKFNIFNIIISTFVFGLGIDYSIFIIKGLQQEYKFGMKNLSSFKTSIILSAFTTITGIGVLIFAKHPALKSIALVSVIGILSVIIVSFTLQPLLFRLFISNKKKKGLPPVTFFNLFSTFVTIFLFLVGALIMKPIDFILFNIIPHSKENKKRKLFSHKLVSFLNRIDVYALPYISKKIINENNENFLKPSVIICNHQSHIDLSLILMMHPKMIIMTNDWVWNNPFYGSVIKHLDFYPVSDGYENSLEKLGEKVKDGYSIVVFPEGTRSINTKIGRFHKGAFFIAEKLKLDILPVMLHGTGDTQRKDELLVRKSKISIKFLDRISPDDGQYGENYSKRAKLIGKYFREEYQKFRLICETPKYFRNKLINNYIYKGPILEWYTRVKLSLEDNYELLNKLIPREGKITDIGCGYGYQPYMLHFLSSEREITAIDYDENKIETAANCPSKNDKLKFICSSAVDYEYTNQDAFILSDVLHYLLPEDQKNVLRKIFNKLNDGGVIIIRDGDKDKKKRHWGTQYTEFFSTNFGFNKKDVDRLHFISGTELKSFAEENGFDVEVIDNTQLTSNIFFLLRRK